MFKTVICECYICEAKTTCNVLAEGRRFEDHGEHEGVRHGYEYEIYALQCHQCGTVLFGEEIPPETGYASRVYPEPEEFISYVVPKHVRVSLSEAIQCFRARAYNACAVMCGRALEAICHEHGVKKSALIGGLKELRQKGILDERMFEWSDMLRTHRNIGAHLTDQEITKEDAKELLDFTKAIVDYIFVLSHRFQRFLERHKKENEP